jgi:hypothetical protein
MFEETKFPRVALRARGGKFNDIVKRGYAWGTTFVVLPESVGSRKAFNVEGLGLPQGGYGAGFILMKFWSFYNVHQAECDLEGAVLLRPAPTG